MTEAWEAPLREAVAREHDNTVALLQRLVRIPSVNPKFVADPAQNREAEVQDAIEAELRALGFTTERSFPLPNRPNLYGHWAGGQERSLALCGHVDVVPVGDRASWTTDPFGAEIRDGRMYGRGAGDMKAGLAACIAACRAIRGLGLVLDGRLEFHAVVDEEAGGFGAMQAAARQPAPGAVLVAESSGGTIRPSAGGLEWVRVVVRGLNGHSSRRFASIYPGDHPARSSGRSVNAIELGARLLGAVRELETEWGVNRSYPGMPPGMNTISPGVMVAGAGCGPDGMPTILSNPAIVPDTCTIDFDLKFLPHERSADIRREFEACIARFAASDPWLREHPPQVIWDLYGLHFPPVDTPVDHPLSRALRESREAAGLPVTFEGALGVTDAAHYAAHGIKGIVYGALSADAHGPDESVDLASLLEAAQMIAAATVRFCGLRT
ncbi:M20 family metallopeptidase [Pararoseomonas indoligenes]|uniref:Probable succinyl-diaminopimelate desuccinylase n=1 Tax=Roseomonas indoligenes TaxID=2820811 RepID=A0A940S8B7_9PROT|nr:ArgE/DapE family deacylase [Pararoseomonas indoligenes]MBP0495929.1 ArgE/DapE family deacylase [Pararoseomonas indoligenes]